MRKGRGIARPGLLAALGPSLRSVLDITADTAEEEARTRFLTLINGETANLPNDLALLVQAAFGITSSHALLNERLADVGHLLQRDARTLRRRLAEADELLADKIMLRFAPRHGLARPGWHWVSYRMEVDVSDDRPVFVSTRTLVSALDDLTEFGEIVSVPVTGDADSLRVEGLSGCTYIGCDPLSGTSWRLRFQLPRPLAAGETHDTVVRFTWPGRESIQPIIAFVPMRPVERYEVKISFGTPRSCADAWVVDGMLPTSMADPPLDDMLVSDDEVEVAFDDLMLGHAYGVAWTWA